MKKKIWIWNHYATDMYFNEGGRHYWFAENLLKHEYEPTIFCANTRHNNDEIVNIERGKFKTAIKNKIPFVFIKTYPYSGNGKDRIKNMISFYKNLFSVSKEYSKKAGKPDVILASSVHPLTLVAGIKIAKKFGVPCICEVRDLWPETLVAYGALKENTFFTKLLYAGEKWIYKKSDKLIFTMEGGKDYLIDKGWDKDSGGPIDLDKVFHINNGVDFEVFNYNKENYVLNDEDLDNPNYFKVIYAGSIRLVNNVKSIIDAAKEIKNLGVNNIKFILYGDGSDKKSLEEYCKEYNINNVIFKGLVDKKYVPSILSKSDLNIFHFQQNNIKKYGASLNKMFEYFASGKPTISDCEFGYDIIKKFNCGFVIDNATPEQLAEKIIEISKMSQVEYQKYCDNALMAAKEYDFKILTEKLKKLF
ncbi:MAG: glycosyltransferase family 4 protein [Caldibacillus thermoamylovorans]